MDPVPTLLSLVDEREMRPPVATIGCAATAADLGQRVVRASLVRVADTVAIALLERHARLKAATALVESQAVMRRLATETIATMALGQLAVRVRLTALRVATEAAAEIKVAATVHHEERVPAVQVASAAAAAAAVVQQVVGDLVQILEAGAEANTRRLGLKRRQNVALLK